MAGNTPEDKLAAFFAQTTTNIAQSDPAIAAQLDNAISNPELDNIKNQKATLRAKINVLGLFQKEVQGMIENIEKSQVVLVLTDVVTLGGGDEGQAYQLITQYLELTSQQREKENKAFAVIPIRVTAVQLRDYLGRLQCFPRYGKSIGEKTHESIGLTEVASAIRDLYDKRFANNSASLSVVCSPQNHDMFAKVTAHLLASGVVDNKYYHSGFQLLTNATQQQVLDETDPVSLDIDGRIAASYAADPGGNMLEYAKKALQENPDTAGIIENIDSSDIILLGMHADLLGKRRYRLVEMYLKHVTEQKKASNKPFIIIPVYLGACGPDSWVNVYRPLPRGFDKDNPSARLSIETASNKEGALVGCATDIAGVAQDFVRSQGTKQLQCFPLYPVSQMATMDRFINHLQAARLVGNSADTIATAPIKIVQTEQVQAIKSQGAIGDKNKFIQFVSEMTTKVNSSDLLLFMLDAHTTATSQFDALCEYYEDVKDGKKAYNILVSEMPQSDKTKKYGTINFREPIKGGRKDEILSNIVAALKKQFPDATSIPKRILIAVNHENKELADGLSAHLTVFFKRLHNTQIDFLYI